MGGRSKESCNNPQGVQVVYVVLVVNVMKLFVEHEWPSEIQWQYD